MRLRFLAGLIVLAGCGSAAKGPPPDETLNRLDHAGDIAFNLEQPAQAAEQYRAALKRARTRDDAGAIADAGFNLATAELRAGQPRAAIETAKSLQAELSRRGAADPGFDLVTATALYRLGDLAAADRVAAGLTGSNGLTKPGPATPGPATPGPATVDAAWFLRGLIADERRDRAGLQTAAGSLTTGADAGDVAELRARLTHNRDLALHAADLRRGALDYRGMARSLALAAEFTPDATGAADLYLRAGRSAAAQGDAADARIWLGLARERALDGPLRQEVDRALRDVAVH